MNFATAAICNFLLHPASTMLTALVACSLIAGTASAQSGGPATTNTTTFGEKLPFQNGELYFTDNVTQRQAESLVKFLDEMYGDLENFKSYQLDRDGNELVVRSVVNDRALNTNELDDSFEAVEFLLQTQVFPDSEVRLELTDTQFQTRRTFNKLGIYPFGKRVTFNKNELYYTKDVTRQEVDKLIKYLMSTGGADTEVSFQLDRDGDTLVVRMVGSSEAIKTSEFDASFDAMEREFQQFVFTDTNVRFEVTDFKFEPAKIIDKIPR